MQDRKIRQDRYTEDLKLTYHFDFYRFDSYRKGKSQEIISNGKDKADSGKKRKNRHASPSNIRQGSCKETVGNNSGKQ